LGIEQLIEFKPNTSFNTIIEEMFKSKVYFHTMRGEHFGISIVEAMSAGLVPVVPNYGGCAEFVPKEYQYDTIDAASTITKSAFTATSSDRKRMSNIADQFSDDAFKTSMKKIIKETLEVRASKRLTHLTTEA
jgi:glycosyltransferase involved in cell wall biosynthesis